MKIKVKNLKKALSLFLALVILFSVGAPAYGVEVLGNSGGAGGGSLVTGDTLIPGSSSGWGATDDDRGVVGMRFSIYNVYSKATEGSVIDVYKANVLGGSNCARNLAKFTTKYNKMQWRTKITQSNWSVSTTSAAGGNDILDTNLVLNGQTKLLPPRCSKMKEWESVDLNLNAVIPKLGATNRTTVATLSAGDVVLVEPLFVFKFQGVYYVMTCTEMAVFGAYYIKAGLDSNGRDCTATGTYSTSGAWGNISKYPNNIYPKTMYLPQDGTNPLGDTSMYLSATDASQTTSSGGTKCETFRNIINRGYGIHAAYKNNEPQNVTLTVKHWLYNYDASNNVLSNSYTLQATNTYSLASNEKITLSTYITPESTQNNITGSYVLESGAYSFSNATATPYTPSSTTSSAQTYTISKNGTINIYYAKKICPLIVEHYLYNYNANGTTNGTTLKETVTYNKLDKYKAVTISDYVRSYTSAQGDAYVFSSATSVTSSSKTFYDTSKTFVLDTDNNKLKIYYGLAPVNVTIKYFVRDYDASGK